MKFAAIAAAVCFSSLFPAHAVSHLRAAAATGTPVERVVNLLRELEERLESDEESEQQASDKYFCWCGNTTARKATAIEDADKELRALGQAILSVKGLVATRAFEVAELAAAIKANEESQAQATALRQRGNAVFLEETEELKQAIAALEKAITVLVEGTKNPAFLQSSAAAAQVKAVVAAMPVSKSVKPEQMSFLGEYLRTGTQYLPQSMTVQGILMDMYETFARDLEGATEREATANTVFEGFMAQTTAQLKADRALKAKKEAEKAEAEQMMADAQSLYDDTTEQRKADVKFFNATKAACEAKHKEWTTRSDLREEELAGIRKALKMLTTDAARELFASAIKAGKETGAQDKYDTGRNIAPALVQTSSAPSDAYAAIRRAAKESHSLRLASLALDVRAAKVGHFDKVVAAIDDMIKVLQDEDAADIAKRDQCKDEYLKVESASKDLGWKIEKNAAKIDKLTKLIEVRQEELARTATEIAAADAYMAVITEQRTAENEAFLKAKDEDQRAIDLLLAARGALAAFYKKHKIDMGPIQGSVQGVLLEEPASNASEPVFNVSADQAPDANYTGTAHRKGEAKDIVSIMTMLVEDLNDEIKNGMKAEEEGQKAYDEEMKAARQLRTELVAKKASLEDAIAARGEERSLEAADKETNERLLRDEVEYRRSITADCDWIIGAFEKRAAARRTEKDGLTGAKEFLAGKDALLETKAGPGFDDSALAKVRFLGIRG